MERPMWECTMLAGFGGTMPTLSKFGASLIADPSSPMPAIGFFVGLGIFFLIGSLMAYAFAERNLKQALLAGIAAPAIIASAISGATGASGAPSQAQAGAQGVPSAPGRGASSLLDILVPPAHAQGKKADNNLGELPNPVLPRDGSLLDVDKYKYSLASFPTGSSDWRPSAINLRVTVKDQDGKLVLYKLPSAFTTMNFSSDKPISEVRLEADGFNSTFIPIGMNKGGNILVTPHIETRKDLIWALGGKGSPVVRQVNAQVVPVDRY